MEKAQYNPAFWEQVKDKNGTLVCWKIKKGVNPADAINDVFKKDGGNYALDCASSTNLCFMKAKLDTMGPEAFNKLHGEMGIAGHHTWSKGPDGQYVHDKNGAMSDRLNLDNKPAPVAGPPPLEGGDFCYFVNSKYKDPDRSKFANDEAWQKAVAQARQRQGENAIYLGRNPETGKDEFFGNPIGIIAFDPNDKEPKCEYGHLTGLRGGSPSGEEILAETQAGLRR